METCHVLQPAKREKSYVHDAFYFFVAQRCRHLGSILLAKVKRMEAAFISSFQSLITRAQHQPPARSDGGAGTVGKAASMERVSKSGKRDAWDAPLVLAAKTVTVRKAV